MYLSTSLCMKYIININFINHLRFTRGAWSRDSLLFTLLRLRWARRQSISLTPFTTPSLTSSFSTCRTSFACSSIVLHLYFSSAQHCSSSRSSSSASYLTCCAWTSAPSVNFKCFLAISFLLSIVFSLDCAFLNQYGDFLPRCFRVSKMNPSAPPCITSR